MLIAKAHAVYIRAAADLRGSPDPGCGRGGGVCGCDGGTAWEMGSEGMGVKSWRGWQEAQLDIKTPGPSA